MKKQDSQLVVEKKDGKDNIYYLNISVYNTQSSPSLIPAQYSESRTDVILKDTQNYYMSIVRFEVPGDALPILIAENRSDSSTVNDLAYSVTLEYSSQVQRVYLQYVSQNSVSAPSSVVYPSTSQSVYRYYEIYHYQQFVDMVNVAFNTAFGLLTGLDPSISAEPYITFDPTTKLFTLVAQKSYVTNNLKIYMNEILYALFDGFNAKQTYLSSGRDYQIMVRNNYNNSITIPTFSPGAGTAGYTIIQNYPSLQAFNSVTGIVLVSNTLGNRKEYMHSSEVYSKNIQQNIVSDFIISDLDQAESRNIVYLPSAEYRMIELTSDGDLVKLDISAYWVGKDQTMYPIYVSSLSPFTCKIMFRRKDWNK